MRAVVQRVTSAGVKAGAETVGAIGPGFCVLVGVADGDGPADVEWLSEKLAGLRIFDDPQGRPNLNLVDTKGSLLLVSQFTLLADARTGRRPSYTAAARPEAAEPLFNDLVEKCRTLGITCATGRFGAMMTVEIVNDGPFTILLDSRKTF